MTTATNTAPAVTLGTVLASSEALVKAHTSFQTEKVRLTNATDRVRAAFDAFCKDVASLCESMTLGAAAEKIIAANATVVVPTSTSGGDWQLAAKVTELKVAQLRDAHLMAEITGGKPHQHFSQVGFTGQSKVGTSFGVNWERLQPAVKELAKANEKLPKDKQNSPVELVALGRHQVNVAAMQGRDIKAERDGAALVKYIQNFTGVLTDEQWVLADRAMKALRPE